MPAYELRRSARRRTLSIEVHPGLRVVVRAPLHMDRGVIDGWIAGRSAWIERQFERFRSLGFEPQPPPAPLRHVTGESHVYLGKVCRLDVVAASRPGITLDGDALRVAVRGGADGETVRRMLDRWYRERAGEVFTQIITGRFGWFACRGHLLPVLTIRAMTSRWGSLSVPGRAVGLPSLYRLQPRRMTLNLALIRAPRECVEYVVVHELCHLEERGHGPAFHRLMDEQLPDWRERRRRLEAARLLG